MTNEIKDVPNFDEITDESIEGIFNIKHRYNNFFPSQKVSC